MGKDDKKQVLLALIVVVVLFVVFSLFGILYNIYKNNKVVKYDLISSFEDSNDIYIDNTLPVSDELGKEFDGTGSATGIQGYKEFSIKNKNSDSVTYVIYIKKNDVCSSFMNESFVKFYLTDFDDNPLSGFEKNKLPTYTSLSVLDDEASAKLLYTGSIEGKSTAKFKLRVWVSDLYTVDRDRECFSFDVFAKNK